MLTDEQAIKLYDGITKVLQSEYGWGTNPNSRQVIRNDANVGLKIMDEIEKYIEYGEK